MLRCPGRLLPMAVVLGLVTGSVLSGPAKVQEGDYGKSMDNMVLPVMRRNQLKAQDTLSRLWQEEALKGRNGDTDLGLFALPDSQYELGQVPQVRSPEALEGGCDGDDNEPLVLYTLRSIESSYAGYLSVLWKGDALDVGRDSLVKDEALLLARAKAAQEMEQDIGQPLLAAEYQETDRGLAGQGEVIDATPDFRMRAVLSGWDAVRVAAERVVVWPKTEVSQGLDGPALAPSTTRAGTSDMPPADAGGEVIDGELWLISHYTAKINWGYSTYPYGSPTASGIPAQPGVVACGASYLGKTIVLAGWEMSCADTGNPAYVYDGVADIWCEGETWGPPNCTTEWWCGLPCPAPCEWEIGGRCYVKVRVVR